jgi:malonate transporter and related proteins
MSANIIQIVAPVFLLIGLGYLAVRLNLFADAMVDGLNKFVVGFAIPALLFNATSKLDLEAAFDWRFMLAFYLSATLSFFFMTLVARKVFHRTPGEAVSVGFGAFFSNSLLLGLPISELAYGTESLATNYAIISLHAPFCYLVGISIMEMLRADGRSFAETVRVVARAMFRNSLMIGLALGFTANLTGLVLPDALQSAIDMMSRAALPAALFGLGAILTRYSVRHTFGESSVTSLTSLVLHPSLAYAFCVMLGVPEPVMKSVVLTAAMAPGVNAYLFAAMYNKALGAAASTVVLGTILSVFTISVWLWVLG